MSDPVFLKVPMLDVGEVGLIGVLEYVVQHFGAHVYPRPLDQQEVARAVQWLHAKYGVAARGGEGNDNG